MTEIVRTPKQLGAALRRRRRAIGLSQAQLAERVALRQATVSDIETDASYAKTQTILDILTALGLEIEVRPRSAISTPSIEDIY